MNMLSFIDVSPVPGLGRCAYTGFGEDVDNCIMSHLLNEFKRQYRRDVLVSACFVCPLCLQLVCAKRQPSSAAKLAMDIDLFLKVLNFMRLSSVSSLKSAAWIYSEQYWIRFKSL